MPPSLNQTVKTYKSIYSGQEYLYDIISDAQNNVYVRNIRGPRGLVTDSTTQIPQAVVQDIQEATYLVGFSSQELSVYNNSLVFQGETQLAASIPNGTLNTIDYRVVYTTTDGIYLITENKTLTSFDAVAPIAYGSVMEPRTVDYTVFVSDAPVSSFGGFLTFAYADNSQKTVAFTNALPNTNYRVVLTPSGFFSAQVLSKAKTGFTVSLGISLRNNGEMVTVGYDVIV